MKIRAYHLLFGVSQGLLFLAGRQIDDDVPFALVLWGLSLITFFVSYIDCTTPNSVNSV